MVNSATIKTGLVREFDRGKKCFIDSNGHI